MTSELFSLQIATGRAGPTNKNFAIFSTPLKLRTPSARAWLAAEPGLRRFQDSGSQWDDIIETSGRWKRFVRRGRRDNKKAIFFEPFCIERVLPYENNSMRPEIQTNWFKGEQPLEDNDAGPTDAEILQKLQHGKIDALEVLVNKYVSALTRAAYAYLQDRHTAQDVVQDVFIAAWDSASKARTKSNLRSWLFGILFNQCRKHRRSAARRLRRELDATQRKAGNDQRAVNQQHYGPMQQAIQRLEDKHLAVVVLRYERGLSVAETADALQIPEGTVKSRTSAALAKMRSYMRRNDERN